VHWTTVEVHRNHHTTGDGKRVEKRATHVQLEGVSSHTELTPDQSQLPWACPVAAAAFVRAAQA